MVQSIKCPHCQKEIKVETDMYIDSGDVCYDIMVDEEMAEENEELFVPTYYTCLSCVGRFKLELDENFWGSTDIPLIVKPTK